MKQVLQTLRGISYSLEGKKTDEEQSDRPQGFLLLSFGTEVLLLAWWS